MKAVIVGNCQIEAIANCMRAMNPILEIDSIGMEAIEQNASYTRDRLRTSDLVFLQTLTKSRFPELFSDHSDRVLLFPRIYFAAYHPDIMYLRSAGRLVATPLGDYNSKLVLAGYLNGLTARETIELFSRDVFHRIGYLDAWDSAVSIFLDEARQTRLPLDEAPVKWSRSGCFMHSVNHPKLHVLADMARMMLIARGLKVRTSKPENYVRDHLMDGPIWPVYPEIAAYYGLEGDYCFKTAADDPNSGIISLGEFVERSFSVYANLPPNTLVANKFDILNFGKTVFNQVKSPVLGSASKANQSDVAAAKSHPYASLGSHQFWRTAVASARMAEVDPVGPVAFRIDPEDKVASIGSCFAQHISHRLQDAGFEYYLTEAKSPEMGAEEAKRRSFGVFSARYGNVYTARQLIQLMDRAFGNFEPAAAVWRRPDGRLVDPFRPLIEPDGYETEQEMESSRSSHLAAVRRLFETLDVLVVTLGLTEAWRSKRDGAVFPVAPGVVAGELNLSTHEFVNFGADEIATDLEGVLRRMASVNSRAKVILTVSPVPLVATCENRHVLVSNTFSKSALRAAADTVCRNNDNVQYFPAYEIINSSFSRGEYFTANLRSVTPRGVDHVMRLFLRHLCPSVPDSSRSSSTDLRSGYDIVCDEERSVAGQPTT